MLSSSLALREPGEHPGQFGNALLALYPLDGSAACAHPLRLWTHGSGHRRRPPPGEGGLPREPERSSADLACSTHVPRTARPALRRPRRLHRRPSSRRPRPRRVDVAQARSGTAHRRTRPLRWAVGFRRDWRRPGRTHVPFRPRRDRWIPGRPRSARPPGRGPRGTGSSRLGAVGQPSPGAPEAEPQARRLATSVRLAPSRIWRCSRRPKRARSAGRVNAPGSSVPAPHRLRTCAATERVGRSAPEPPRGRPAPGSWCASSVRRRRRRCRGMRSGGDPKEPRRRDPCRPFPPEHRSRG